jgi:hypothetical protein
MLKLKFTLIDMCGNYHNCMLQVLDNLCVDVPLKEIFCNMFSHN